MSRLRSNSNQTNRTDLSQKVRCPICYQHYTQTNESIKVCVNQHNMCRQCIKKIFSKKDQRQPLCPFCKLPLSQLILKPKYIHSIEQQNAYKIARWQHFITYNKSSSYLCMQCGNPYCSVQFKDQSLPKRAGLCFEHTRADFSYLVKKQIFPCGQKATKDLKIRQCDMIGDKLILRNCQQCRKECEFIYTYGNSLNGICQNCLDYNAQH